MFVFEKRGRKKPKQTTTTTINNNKCTKRISEKLIHE
jgi:hypothetical protein